MVSSILISGVVRAIVGWTILPVSLFLNLGGMFSLVRGEVLFFLFHSMFFKKDPSYFNRFLSELKTKGMRNNKAWIFFLIETLWKISFARFAATSIKFLFLLF